MWDLWRLVTVKAFVAASFALLSLLATGCSDTAESSGDGPRQGSGGYEESTLVSSQAGLETTGEGSLPEATLGSRPDPPGVLLRLEGDPGTTFSGICAVGSRENVLSGRVPRRYAFEPRGQRLSCRIEKRDAGRGVLTVILVAGDTTRSVQETNTDGGAVNISYTGG